MIGVGMAHCPAEPQADLASSVSIWVSSAATSQFTIALIILLGFFARTGKKIAVPLSSYRDLAITHTWALDDA